MTRAATLLAVTLVALAGCRLETPANPPPADDVASAHDVAAGDGVAAESTAAVDAPVSTPPDTLRAPSGLVIPVAGVGPDKLADTFSDAREGGRVHDAIDILAPRGTPVVAAAAGHVARLFTSERGGLTVYVVSPDPAGGALVYYYAHLDAYAPGLADGQDVRAGQTLGTVGDSGNAVPGNTHLHFAIWRVDDPARFWDGPALNPYPLLGGR